MTVANVSKKNKDLIGKVTLNGSKSIANRALIIRALCEEDFPIHKLSNSKDTVLMDKLLKSNFIGNITYSLTLYKVFYIGNVFIIFRLVLLCQH